MQCDKGTLDRVLVGLRDLPEENWCQHSPTVIIRVDGTIEAANGYFACAGAWAGAFLRKAKFPPAEEPIFLSLGASVRELAELFGMTVYELEHFLNLHGAGTREISPFGARKWDNTPFEVFKSAMEDRFDYKFEPEEDLVLA